MNNLTRDEKKELRRLAHSSALKNDCRKMKKTNHRKEIVPDEFIRFVDFFNAFTNHPLKPFRKITGNHFKL